MKTGSYSLVQGIHYKFLDGGKVLDLETQSEYPNISEFLKIFQAGKPGLRSSVSFSDKVKEVGGLEGDDHDGIPCLLGDK